jgi:hypothetical protein
VTEIPTAFTTDDVAMLGFIDKPTLYAVAKRLAEELSTEGTLEILHAWERLYLASEVRQSPKDAKAKLEELLMSRAESRLRETQPITEITHASTRQTGDER